MHELEGFTYATALDLNMGYYTIRLDHDVSRYNTIILLTYNFVQTYLDNLLMISKDSLDDHLKKLREVFIKLKETRLKINADKSNFCTTETEYLGYALTRKGIKPQTKKIESIPALKPPTNIKELPRFLGMVQ